MISETTWNVVKDCVGSNEYTFPFRIYNADDLEVIYISDDGFTQTTLEKETDYTVSGEAGKFLSGGTVTTVETYADGQLSKSFAP